MIAFLSTWRDMGWQAALVLLFGFLALLAMLGVWLCMRFGGDEYGRYIPPKDLDPKGRFSSGRDTKEKW